MKSSVAPAQLKRRKPSRCTKMVARTNGRLCFSASAIVLFGFIAACAVQSSGQGMDTAKSALARMARATGWSKATVPADAVITGTITRHFSDGSSSNGFTTKIRGLEQFRYAEDGTSLVLVTNGAAGALVSQDGKATRIPAHSALSSRGLILPMASVLSDWNSPEVDITVVGPNSVNGEACVGIRLVRRHADSDPLAKIRRAIAPMVVWVSISRGVILRAEHSRAAVDNANASMQETVDYSDYRTVNGIAVPFHQEIWIGGQHTQTFQFSSVRFNTGLTDADFNVAAVAGGAR